MSNISSGAGGGEEDFYDFFLRMTAGEIIDAPDKPSIKQQVADNNRHVDFCLVLLNARIRKHITQTTLAEMIGTSKSVVQAAESRRGNPHLLTLLLIAEALGVRLTLTE